MRHFVRGLAGILCVGLTAWPVADVGLAHAASGGPVQSRPQVGDERVFRITYKGWGQFDQALLAQAMTRDLGAVHGPAGKAQRQTIDYDLSAELNWRVVARDPKGYTVAARLQHTRYAVGGSADQRRALLEAPFLIYSDARGAMREFSFVAHYPQDLAAAVRSFVEPMQVVVDSEAGASWLARENDSGTIYEVRYDLENVSTATGVARLAKTKTKVLLSNFAATPLTLPIAPQAQIIASTGAVDWSLTGGLSRIEAHDHLLVTSGKRTLTEHQHAYTAVRIDQEVVALAATLADARAALSDPAFARARMYQVDPDMLATVQGMEVDGAVAAFTTALAKNYAVAHRVLKNFIRLHPEASAAVAERLIAMAETTELTDDAGATKIGFGWAALASAGHDEAQTVLLEACTNTAHKALTREKSLIAIMDLQAPQASTVAAVWALRASLTGTDAWTAVMRSLTTNAYGALGDVRKGNAKVTEAVVKTLAQELKSTHDPREQKLILDGLSNVGDLTSVEPVVAPMFATANEKVRARAFATFRRMPGDVAFARFAARFEKETALLVRRKAVRTVVDMEASAARNAWAARQVKIETDRKMLVHLVRIVGAGLKNDAYPENAPVLRELLQTTRDRKIRREIYAFVAPTRAGGDR